MLRNPLWKSLWMLPLLAACGGGSTTLDMALEVDPATVTLPAVAIGETADRVIQLRHIGTEGTIRLESFQWTGDAQGEFRHDPPPVMELAPGEKTSFAIHYTPKDPNPKDVRLVITHNVAPDYRTEVLVVALGQSTSLRTVPGDLDAQPDIFQQHLRHFRALPTQRAFQLRRHLPPHGIFAEHKTHHGRGDE